MKSRVVVVSCHNKKNTVISSRSLICNLGKDTFNRDRLQNIAIFTSLIKKTPSTLRFQAISESGYRK